MRDLNQVSGTIVDAAFHIHSALGPGLLESVYEVVLARVLESGACRRNARNLFLLSSKGCGSTRVFERIS